MRWRRYFTFVALLGVIVHAGLVVRHHQVMLGAHLDRQELIAALGVICHGSGEATPQSDSANPWVPLPAENQNNLCPLCAGVASAFTLAAAAAESYVPVQFRAAAPPLVRYETRPVEIAALRPPTRGPPLRA